MQVNLILTFANHECNLVTGCCGFIGRHICESYLHSGEKVVGIDSNKVPAVDFLSHPHFLLIPTDIEVFLAEGSFEGRISKLFHCAGVSDLGECQAKRLDSIQVNILQAVKLFEWYLNRDDEGQFVFFSSIYAVGNSGGVYGLTKGFVEQYLVETKSVTQWPGKLTILRVGTVWGPGAPDSNSITRMIRQALSTTPTYPRSLNDTLREYLHISDLLELIAKAIELDSGIYLLSGLERMSSHHVRRDM